MDTGLGDKDHVLSQAGVNVLGSHPTDRRSMGELGISRYDWTSAIVSR